MGLFSKKRNKDSDGSISSAEIHDSFADFVREAKFVGSLFGLDFLSMSPHQKVFAFMHENPSCVAFVVPYGEGINLIQCLEEGPKVIEIPFSEILEIEILPNYKSEALEKGDQDPDDSPVRHLRFPRKAMSLKTNEVNSVLIATSEQMEFVYGYLIALRGLPFQ